jgi:hypothetical protein
VTGWPSNAPRATDRGAIRSSVLAKRGDLKLTDFLAQATADCPRRKAGGFRDVCKARFEF